MLQAHLTYATSKRTREDKTSFSPSVSDWALEGNAGVRETDHPWIYVPVPVLGISPPTVPIQIKLLPKFVLFCFQLVEIVGHGYNAQYGFCKCIHIYIIRILNRVLHLPNCNQSRIRKFPNPSIDLRFAYPLQLCSEKSFPRFACVASGNLFPENFLLIRLVSDENDVKMMRAHSHQPN